MYRGRPWPRNPKMGEIDLRCRAALQPWQQRLMRPSPGCLWIYARERTLIWQDPGCEKPIGPVSQGCIAPKRTCASRRGGKREDRMHEESLHAIILPGEKSARCLQSAELRRPGIHDAPQTPVDAHAITDPNRRFPSTAMS